ncbi:oxygen-independent coproporphyrinogen III oxidase [Flavobacterium sp.]|uniref:oxygen-independent coproporphyrinogen III oxidase n=1 Tax=Flavobacterium sp. TaxID=239 RepID=UPI003B995410
MNLFDKYNTAAPRYTSYPTVPYWDETTFSTVVALERLQQQLETENTLSLYIHLPFCERLCTFCGCHKYITKRHEVEQPYIEALLKEWHLYLELLPAKPVLKELHLGGGTPTFFSPLSLEHLLTEITSSVEVDATAELGFEGHPHSTSAQHLRALRRFGFTRVSFGVQDYNPHIQQAISRQQTFNEVAKVSFMARELGYKSVSHDLVYGLPFQCENDIIDSIEKTTILRPDRISLYSYAHVPWVKGTGQRGFKTSDLPEGAQKRKLYEIARELLLENDYVEIGMDHFALPTDDLFRDSLSGQLNRNFMGYTTAKAAVQLGLGVSAIGNSKAAFMQNTKDLKQYYKLLEDNTLPITKGHLLSHEDLCIQQHILNIMCRLQTTWTDELFRFIDFQTLKNSLRTFMSDGLLELTETGMQVLEAGRPFLRNICMAFDLRLQRKWPDIKLFSSAV